MEERVALWHSSELGTEPSEEGQEGNIEVLCKTANAPGEMEGFLMSMALIW